MAVRSSQQREYGSRIVRGTSFQRKYPPRSGRRPHVLPDNRDVTTRLTTHGAVLIEGTKAVGKTTTGLTLCTSHVRLDRDAAARAAASVDPRLVLDGSPPRLIDEYQLVPGLWEAVRVEVDERRTKRLFVLTGSATPDPDTTSHGGAGRIVRYTMRTLSQFEPGRSTGSTSLASLLDRVTPAPDAARASVRETIESVVTGGWPGHADLDAESARSDVRAALEGVLNRAGFDEGSDLTWEGRMGHAISV